MTGVAPGHGGPRETQLFHALIPVVFLIASLGVNVLVFGSSPHIPLILSTAVTALVGWRLGHTWKGMEDGLIAGISQALQACLILMVVGILIGTWIVSGIVPTMISYGLEVLSPGMFLFTACLLCAVVSLATGSSWSTAGTVGVALIGVGHGLGVPLPMVAGAIISGSYLGDKMSPLSDTTNLAPAVAGTDLFTHIRHMVYTTGPSFVLALLAYLALGLFFHSDGIRLEAIRAITAGIEGSFTIHPLLLVPPVLVIVMVMLRLPALPALLAGAILGGLFALAVQGASVKEVMEAAYGGYVSRTGVASIDDLLTRGGLVSMYSTLALILCALAFGGVMETTGMLAAIARAILKAARSTGSLVLATVATCISMNILAPDQYLSIIVPGRMYQDAYRERGLHLKNLSRALEDGGTLSSSLVPWNTGGAYMYATLGVYPLAYLPFAFLNLLNPVISVIYGYTGITMDRADSKAVSR
ncbi:MAG: Na+/H+ antiporter NhaC [Deltaproteobacteria bacterium]|nr:Na+/H+ antiporter NhaC [Deltaproteobacteria bacterium]